MKELDIDPRWSIATAIANYAAYEQYANALKVYEAGIRDWKHHPAYATSKAQILGQALRAELREMTR